MWNDVGTVESLLGVFWESCCPESKWKKTPQQPKKKGVMTSADSVRLCTKLRGVTPERRVLKVAENTLTTCVKSCKSSEHDIADNAHYMQPVIACPF
jgi:hypothetical protein